MSTCLRDLTCNIKKIEAVISTQKKLQLLTFVSISTFLLAGQSHARIYCPEVDFVKLCSQNEPNIESAVEWAEMNGWSRQHAVNETLFEKFEAIQPPNGFHFRFQLRQVDYSDTKFYRCEFDGFNAKVSGWKLNCNSDFLRINETMPVGFQRDLKVRNDDVIIHNWSYREGKNRGHLSVHIRDDAVVFMSLDVLTHPVMGNNELE